MVILRAFLRRRDGGTKNPTVGAEKVRPLRAFPPKIAALRPPQSPDPTSGRACLLSSVFSFAHAHARVVVRRRGFLGMQWHPFAAGWIARDLASPRRSWIHHLRICAAPVCGVEGSQPWRWVSERIASIAARVSCSCREEGSGSAWFDATPAANQTIPRNP